MEFKFEMGAVVRMRPGTEELLRVIARIETTHGPHYRISTVAGGTSEVREKSLWLVHCVPRWLRPGAEIQWMGRGHHWIYVVRDVRRGSKCKSGHFTAKRKLTKPDSSSFGTESVHSRCLPDDMEFWRPAPKNSGRLAASAYDHEEGKICRYPITCLGDHHPRKRPSKKTA